MKSKRAEEYIDTFRVYSDFYDGCGFIVSEGDASSAVEIAEEDMVETAAKAFCAVHCPKGCPFDNTEECGAIRGFKQKLM
jgi:hypothetical protein